jgi:hypothetical protein
MFNLIAYVGLKLGHMATRHRPRACHVAHKLGLNIGHMEFFPNFFHNLMILWED